MAPGHCSTELDELVTQKINTEIHTKSIQTQYKLIHKNNHNNNTQKSQQCQYSSKYYTKGEETRCMCHLPVPSTAQSCPKMSSQQ